MTFEEFDRVTERLFGEIRRMRDTKGKEYARSIDRFDNFNRLAQTLGISREKVLWTYAAKHLDGILSYVNTGRIHSSERVEGRIVDAVTYLLLLAGMVAENDLQLTLDTLNMDEDGNARPLGFGSQTNHPIPVFEGLQRKDLDRETWAEGILIKGEVLTRCHWYTSRGRCILSPEHLGDHRNDIG